MDGTVPKWMDEFEYINGYILAYITFKMIKRIEIQQLWGILMSFIDNILWKARQNKQLIIVNEKIKKWLKTC